MSKNRRSQRTATRKDTLQRIVDCSNQRPLAVREAKLRKRSSTPSNGSEVSRQLTIEDLRLEGSLSLQEAAAMIGEASGRRPSVSTVTRWIIKGVRGVKLAALRIGGRWHTTIVAVDEFCHQTSAASRGLTMPRQSSGTAAGTTGVDPTIRYQQAIARFDPDLLDHGAPGISPSKAYLDSLGLMNFLMTF